MRVVAARFSEARRANAVLDALHRLLHVAPRDAEVAPLGTPGKPEANDAVLAGRFADDQAAAVRDLVQRGGGEVVADVDERLTRRQPPEVERRADRRIPRSGTTGLCLGSRGRAS